MVTRKKTSKPRKDNRNRYYGLTKLKRGTKFSWLSLQNRHGWSLGFALGKRTYYLCNIRFASKEEVKQALNKSKIVFIPLRNNARNAKYL